MSTTARTWVRLAGLSRLSAALSLLALTLTARADTTPPNLVALPDHVPQTAIAQAHLLGRMDADRPIQLALVLPLRNQTELENLIQRLYDPRDPLYGKYLTPEQFTAMFGPTQTDYEAVAAFSREKGLTITGIHANRALLDVAGPAGVVEAAFNVHLLRYQAKDGREFYAPDVDPSVPAPIAARMTGIVGLDNAAVIRPHIRRSQPPAGPVAAFAGSHQIGGGPGGALRPSDIKAAYNLSNTSLNGSGQTLGLFELDGYTATDITNYENNFGLTHVPLQNVLLDGATGGAGSGAGEVTLDIELQVALAPGATKIIVYEAPNSSTGLVDEYNRIASDNLAKEISTSWGLYESGSGSSTINSENTAFSQMATQGQSIYAAAGDSGAYDDGSTLSVDDPASQPYMVGVGGTTLSVTGVGGPWSSETTWNGGSVSAGAGGGGISSVWSIPSYQSGVVSSASHGSTTMRNVPDVSLDADPNTGYAIYVGGAWNIYGGTSCAAPLWAAFTALVNQQRVANSQALLGFANPAIYNVAKGSRYASDFHDVADGSTNLYYPAVAGYDDATGWGSYNGANLLADLAGSGSSAPTISSISPSSATAGGAAFTLTVNGTNYVSGAAVKWNGSALTTTFVSSTQLTASVPASDIASTGTASVTVTSNGQTSNTATFTINSATVKQLLGNPGFENGSSNPAPWHPTAGVIDNSGYEPPHSGSWVAWLDGYGYTHTDTLYQDVTIPSNITKATLSFWLHIDTAETTTTTAYDVLKVQIRNTSNTVLTTLATFSNLNAAGGYTQHSYDVSAYKGQTIRVYFIGTEDSSLQTSFVIDDTALNVQ